MSERLIPLTNNGVPVNLSSSVVGSIATNYLDDIKNRKDRILVLEALSPAKDYSGYEAIITKEIFGESLPEYLRKIPLIHSVLRINHLVDGDIVSINQKSGFMRTLFRVKSKNNVIFATDRCNSLCLMCSQPPKKIDDSEKVEINLKMIRLIKPETEFIGISGGEPTLLKEGLFKIKLALKQHLPQTSVNMLTNGRMFCYEDFAQEYASIDHPSFCAAIPLYSDIPEEHDFVVQSPGAFVQTMRGIYNLGVLGQPIEIRVVIHKLTYGRLLALAKFIYRNMPFVSHIALMGLEIMGYTKKNLEMLWIDPADYQVELFDAVQFLNSVGLRVSIYNHQLCVLRRDLWPFARQSISDFKNIYLDECEKCSVNARCGGLFKSAQTIHSKYIKAIL